MADLVKVWYDALPGLRHGVTGVGVWAALNAAVPVLVEGDVAYIGLRPDESELAGHLKLPATKQLMETSLTARLGTPISVRIIDGTTPADVEMVKRRDAERRRLQELELQKMRQEMQAKTSWDAVYEQLSRRYAAVTNKSLPQNRARFLEEALELVAEARRGQAQWDESGERNFARCIERVAQYSDLPSTFVAVQVMQRSGEL